MKINADYDAMGQRIAKTVTNKNVTTGDKFVTTYYMRDPQGNVLAVYEHKHGDSDNGTFTLTEQHLYGASRLGMKKRDLALNVANANESPATYYELTNHLGNVMAVISDKASTTAEPTVVSLSDYYPFGMTEPGRSYTRPGDDYRFGYTGHEKENDLAEGVYTTEYRLLDTRLGRWMSVDPLFGKYAGMSPYNYCMGNPMVMVDPDGRVVYQPEELYYGRNFLGRGGKIMGPEIGRARDILYKYSPSFRTIYNQLSNSKEDFHIKARKSNWKLTYELGAFRKSERHIYLNVFFQDGGYGTITYNKKYTWDYGTLYEELFHAGQYLYYDKKNKQITHFQKEVEVKVARALWHKYEGICGGDGSKYIATFAAENKKYIDKLMKEGVLSGSEKEEFEANVKKFSEKVRDVYTKNGNHSDWEKEYEIKLDYMYSLAKQIYNDKKNNSLNSATL